MKFRIQHTFELDETQVEAMRLYFDEMGDEDESFKDFIKSYVISGGVGLLEEKAATETRLFKLEE
tara:strand:+ start:164 stop:358 length:195 start_codon:yes stop_codon:yes gene_type:complete